MATGNDSKVLRVFYEGDVSSEGRISHEADFFADSAWVAESTGLPVADVEASIKSLEQLGFLKSDMLHPGKFQINDEKKEDIERALAAL